ncbi:MAG: hypothetical protein J5530_06275 [Clostridia bacterium]|nr:hypothetical protein [Clostridia bacterium]
MGIFKRLFRKKSNCGKRGMTVGEVIIAIAVIVIVTISAAYTIRMSASATSRDFNYERARITARNSLEEFKYDTYRFQGYTEQQFGDYTLKVTVVGNSFTAVITYNDESEFEIRYTKYTKGG